MSLTAVIPGSFDPITVGHVDLVRRALSIFPQAVVAVSSNTEKRYMFSEEKRLAAVRASLEGLDGASAVLMNGLLADFVKSVNGVLIKGARDAVDFDYEKNLFDINDALAGVETIILPAKKELQFISSTFVRELFKYNRPLSGYVPERAIPILKDGCL